MKKLKAKVRRLTGATKHSVITPSSSVSCEDPVNVEIVEQEGAYYLIRYGADDVCIADTWHLTVQEAKEQAEFEFGIIEDDWVELKIV